MSQTDEKLAEAQRRYGDAVQKIEQQQEEKTRPQEEAARAADEIRRLKHIQRGESFESDILDNQAMRRATNDRIDDLLKLLDEKTALFDDIPALVAAVQAAHEQQKRHRENALYQYRNSNPDAAAISDALNNKTDDINQRREAVRAHEQAVSQLRKAEQRLAPPAPWQDMLAAWINRAKSPRQRQIRQALAYSILDRVLDPAPGFRPQL